MKDPVLQVAIKLVQCLLYAFKCIVKAVQQIVAERRCHFAGGVATLFLVLD